MILLEGLLDFGIIWLVLLALGLLIAVFRRQP